MLAQLPVNCVSDIIGHFIIREDLYNSASIRQSAPAAETYVWSTCHSLYLLSSEHIEILWSEQIIK